MNGEERSTQVVPCVNPDGTISARVVQAVDRWGWLHVQAPAGLLQGQEVRAGRYLLARCAGSGGPDRGEDWSIYLRRPLFLCGHYRSGEEERWRLHVPGTGTDPGYGWIRELPEGAGINLLGPLGNGFQLHARSQNLLLLVDHDDDPAWLPWLVPLVEPMLDRGGRVTLLVRAVQPLPQGFLDHLPLALEVRAAHEEAEWQASLAETLVWADQICGGIPPARYPQLRQAIHSHRFRIDVGFAQVLVPADLFCGAGACLACVIPLPGGGVTRACIHGPVFDLTQVTAW